ncbi:hypothetical protein RRG08_029891 [Elysia crispata]|uniref:Uncharacterized protein n=1 Tax=Elysia crispata TaxID=231223 RepID=A0AAE0YJC7_9GAST|nr:hypothetical protein RRG08_029891 [Elysia crispata]
MISIISRPITFLEPFSENNERSRKHKTWKQSSHYTRLLSSKLEYLTNPCRILFLSRGDHKLNGSHAPTAGQLKPSLRTQPACIGLKEAEKEKNPNGPFAFLNLEPTSYRVYEW